MLKIYSIKKGTVVLFGTLLLSLAPGYFVFSQEIGKPSFPAQLRIPDIFSDNMVLQQDTVIRFTGKASPQKKINIVVGWNQDTLVTEALPDATWEISMRTPQSSGPYEIKIICDDTIIVIHNVLIGNVWLCSGQSNMEMSANWGILNYENEIRNANHSEIRFFRVEKSAAIFPQNELHGSWKICSPETMKSFSSVAYFFGRKLLKELNQPIGLIQSAWGGTQIESWMPMGDFYQRSEWFVKASKKVLGPRWPIAPSVIFNAMINPLTNLSLSGIIWYQGEANVYDPFMYRQKFENLIMSWRTQMGCDLPFYFVQIAPHAYSNNLNASLIRQAQLDTYKQLRNTGIVITTDITEPNAPIHPRNKKDVGERLALWALAKNFDHKELSYSGPLFHYMEVKEDKAFVHFYFSEEGLIKKGEKVQDIYIAGKDKQFFPAETKILDSVLVVFSKKVNHPVAVRMGFSDLPKTNLYNRAGLPASPFRTDNWDTLY